MRLEGDLYKAPYHFKLEKTTRAEAISIYGVSGKFLSKWVYL